VYQRGSTRNALGYNRDRKIDQFDEAYLSELAASFVNLRVLCGSGFPRYTVLISKLRHKYQQAMLRYGSHGFAIFSICAGLGSLRLW
jgi:hypothetical protein